MRNVLTAALLHKGILLPRYTFLTMIGQSIIFVNSRETAFRLAKQLRDTDGHSVSLICGCAAARLVAGVVGSFRSC